MLLLQLPDNGLLAVWPSKDVTSYLASSRALYNGLAELPAGKLDVGSREVDCLRWRLAEFGYEVVSFHSDRVDQTWSPFELA